MMVAVTGVSGSGKSTLVHDVIYRSLEALQGARGTEKPTDRPAIERCGARALKNCTCRKVEGAERITDVVMIDQSPIGRTPRSNPVTYIKAFDIIRELVRLHAAKPKSAATRPAIFPSTFPAAAAKPARATAR
jgi:excinuclease ABC subunit A